MKYIVYTFEGLNYSEAASDLLKENNIEARLIPVPSKVQSGCGFCLRSPFENKEEIEKLFDKKDMHLLGRYTFTYGNPRSCTFALPEIEKLWYILTTAQQV